MRTRPHATTAANASANGLDSVVLANRVLNNSMEALVNISVGPPSSSQGIFPAWCPSATISALSASVTGSGSTALATNICWSRDTVVL